MLRSKWSAVNDPEVTPLDESLLHDEEDEDEDLVSKNQDVPSGEQNTEADQQGSLQKADGAGRSRKRQREDVVGVDGKSKPVTTTGLRRGAENMEIQEAKAARDYERALQLQVTGKPNSEDWEEASVLYNNLINMAVLESDQLKLGRTIKRCALANLAAMDECLGNDKSALERLVDATRVDDSNPTIWENIGRLAWKAGNMLLSRFAYEEALRGKWSVQPESLWIGLLHTTFSLADDLACRQATNFILAQDPNFAWAVLFQGLLNKGHALNGIYNADSEEGEWPWSRDIEDALSSEEISRLKEAVTERRKHIRSTSGHSNNPIAIQRRTVHLENDTIYEVVKSLLSEYRRQLLLQAGTFVEVVLYDVSKMVLQSDHLKQDSANTPKASTPKAISMDEKTLKDGVAGTKDVVMKNTPQAIVGEEAVTTTTSTSATASDGAPDSKSSSETTALGKASTNTKLKKENGRGAKARGSPEKRRNSRRRNASTGSDARSLRTSNQNEAERIEDDSKHMLYGDLSRLVRCILPERDVAENPEHEDGTMAVEDVVLSKIDREELSRRAKLAPVLEGPVVARKIRTRRTAQITQENKDIQAWVISLGGKGFPPDILLRKLFMELKSFHPACFASSEADSQTPLRAMLVSQCLDALAEADIDWLDAYRESSEQEIHALFLAEILLDWAVHPGVSNSVKERCKHFAQLCYYSARHYIPQHVCTEPKELIVMTDRMIRLEWLGGRASAIISGDVGAATSSFARCESLLSSSGQKYVHIPHIQFDNNVSADSIVTKRSFLSWRRIISQAKLEFLQKELRRNQDLAQIRFDEICQHFLLDLKSEESGLPQWNEFVAEAQLSERVQLRARPKIKSLAVDSPELAETPTLQVLQECLPHVNESSQSLFFNLIARLLDQLVVHSLPGSGSNSESSKIMSERNLIEECLKLLRENQGRWVPEHWLTEGEGWSRIVGAFVSDLPNVPENPTLWNDISFAVKDTPSCLDQTSNVLLNTLCKCALEFDPLLQSLLADESKGDALKSPDASLTSAGRVASLLVSAMTIAPHQASSALWLQLAWDCLSLLFQPSLLLSLRAHTKGKRGASWASSLTLSSLRAMLDICLVHKTPYMHIRGVALTSLIDRIYNIIGQSVEDRTIASLKSSATRLLADESTITALQTQPGTLYNELEEFRQATLSEMLATLYGVLEFSEEPRKDADGIRSEHPSFIFEKEAMAKLPRALVEPVEVEKFGPATSMEWPEHRTGLMRYMLNYADSRVLEVDRDFINSRNTEIMVHFLLVRSLVEAGPNVMPFQESVDAFLDMPVDKFMTSGTGKCAQSTCQFILEDKAYLAPRMTPKPANLITSKELCERLPVSLSYLIDEQAQKLPRLNAIGTDKEKLLVDFRNDLELCMSAWRIDVGFNPWRFLSWYNYGDFGTQVQRIEMSHPTICRAMLDLIDLTDVESLLAPPKGKTAMAEATGEHSLESETQESMGSDDKPAATENEPMQLEGNDKATTEDKTETAEEEKAEEEVAEHCEEIDEDKPSPPAEHIVTACKILQSALNTTLTAPIQAVEAAVALAEKTETEIGNKGNEIRVHDRVKALFRGLEWQEAYVTRINEGGTYDLYYCSEGYDELDFALPRDKIQVILDEERPRVREPEHPKESIFKCLMLLGKYAIANLGFVRRLNDIYYAHFCKLALQAFERALDCEKIEDKYEALFLQTRVMEKSSYPFNDVMRRYEEVLKIAPEKGDDMAICKTEVRYRIASSRMKALLKEPVEEFTLPQLKEKGLAFFEYLKELESCFGDKCERENHRAVYRYARSILKAPVELIGEKRESYFVKALDYMDRTQVKKADGRICVVRYPEYTIKFDYIARPWWKMEVTRFKHIRLYIAICTELADYDRLKKFYVTVLMESLKLKDDPNCVTILRGACAALEAANQILDQGSVSGLSGQVLKRAYEVYLETQELATKLKAFPELKPRVAQCADEIRHVFYRTTSSDTVPALATVIKDCQNRFASSRAWSIKRGKARSASAPVKGSEAKQV